MTTATLTRRDFASDQAVRWCPGCGDYSILANVQRVMPEFGIPRENFVFISGIGCSSRFPYYMNTYGIHSIHGRAPTLALGLKCARPELQIWVVTGDGDGLAIGGNHFLHALRRNVDINILLINNRIYGLTKGQYSPTSEVGKHTKSSPDGSIENPVNPTGVAIGAEASFIARTVAPFQKHMAAVLARAARHTGACLVEIEQNCVIFNDGAWNHLTEPDSKSDHVLFLEHGKPLRFGKNMEKGIRLNGLSPEVVDVADVGEDALLVHDERATEPTLAYFLSRMGPPDFPTPVGVFRAVEKPVYDELLMEQVHAARAGDPPDLNELYRRGESWDIQARRPEGTLCPSCGHPNIAGADECELCLASLTHEHPTLDERRTRIEESLHGDTVAVLEPSPAIALPETDTVEVALRTLRENDIGCVLVTDGGGRLSGIVTERDLLQRMADELDPTAHRLAEVMTPAPETIRPEHSLAHALHRMTISDLRYLPLVDEDGKPERIVDARDLVGYLSTLVLGEGEE